MSEMKIPPPKINKSERDYLEVVHCAKCGHGKILATHRLDRNKIFESLLKIGWEVAPRIKCRSCACPMEYWEAFNVQSAFDKSLPGRSNENKLYLELKQKAEAKYGKQKLARWFNSIRKSGS